MEKQIFGETQDKLVDKDTKNIKTATSSLCNNSGIPTIGERSVLVNFSNQDKCIIELVDCEIVRYNKLTDHLAILAG